MRVLLLSYTSGLNTSTHLGQVCNSQALISWAQEVGIDSTLQFNRRTRSQLLQVYTLVVICSYATKWCICCRSAAEYIKTGNRSQTMSGMHDTAGCQVVGGLMNWENSKLSHAQNRAGGSSIKRYILFLRYTWIVSRQASWQFNFVSPYQFFHFPLKFLFKIEELPVTLKEACGCASNGFHEMYWASSGFPALGKSLVVWCIEEVLLQLFLVVCIIYRVSSGLSFHKGLLFSLDDHKRISSLFGGFLHHICAP